MKTLKISHPLNVVRVCVYIYIYGVQKQKNTALDFRGYQHKVGVGGATAQILCDVYAQVRI